MLGHAAFAEASIAEVFGEGVGAPEGVQVTTTSLPGAEVGTPYSETLQATGGTEPYTWSIASGALPSGLSLVAATGEISGTPETEETANFTVQVTDDESETDTQALSIEVAPDPNPPTGMRLTTVGVEYLYGDPVRPETPILEASADGTSVVASTSGFASADGTVSHGSTTWQARVTGGGDWETLEVNITSEDEFLTVLLVEDLPIDTSLDFRALHTDSEGLDSEWSNVVQVLTTTPHPRPDTPVLSIEDVLLDAVETSRTPFAHEEGTQDPPDGEEEDIDDILPWHLASQYQIRDRGTETVVLDTGLTGERVELEQFFEAIGEPEDELEIRVRDQDGKYALTSLWSDWVPFDLLALSALRPDKPTITVDVCAQEGIEVSSSVYSTPDEAEPAHTHSRWWIGEGLEADIVWNSTTTSDPTKLLAYIFHHPPPASYWLAVSHRDETGRWSDRSDPVACEILRPGPQPEITGPACSGLVSDDLLISWEPGDETEDWEYTGQIAGPLDSTAAVPEAGWTTLFTRQTGLSHSLEIGSLVDGEYWFRVQACRPLDGPCGEYAYLPVTIDRAGEATLSVVYDFSEMLELPGAWDVVGGGGDITFSLRNRELGTDPPYVGILAKNHRHNAERTAVLRFNELGDVTDIDMEIVFAWVPNDQTWYGWRYPYTQLLRGGVVWRASSPAETGDNRSWVEMLAHPGAGAWRLPASCCNEKCECPCGFVTDGVCRGSSGGAAVWQSIHPNQLTRYAISGKAAGWRTRRRRPASGVPSTWFNTVSAVGALSRGASLARQEGSDPCSDTTDCRWRYRWYTARYRVRRAGGRNTRFQAQVLGPGFDPEAGWQVDRLIPTRSLGLFGDDEIPCGPCGLGYAHIQNLSKDHGVIFRCARVTIYDEVVSAGPQLGTAYLGAGS